MKTPCSLVRCAVVLRTRFVGAAARHGIGVVPAAAFTTGNNHAPNAIRLGLASPQPDILSRALRTLVELARSAPEELVTD
jgi:DNA-binding transcriptional MocR family regulator